MKTRKPDPSDAGSPQPRLASAREVDCYAADPHNSTAADDAQSPTGAHGAGARSAEQRSQYERDKRELGTEEREQQGEEPTAVEDHRTVRVDGVKRSEDHQAKCATGGHGASPRRGLLDRWRLS
jgi:hypothetical protein